MYAVARGGERKQRADAHQNQFAFSRFRRIRLDGNRWRASRFVDRGFVD
jgi:hypothetical protein